MKIEVFTGSPVGLGRPARYVYLKSAVGEIEVSWVENGERRTDRLSAGATLKNRIFSDLTFQAVEQSQVIDVRFGSADDYQPPVTAITSTQIESIQNPVSIAGTVPVSFGVVDVSGSEVVVSGTADVSGSVVDLGSDVEVVGNRSSSVVGSDLTIAAGASVVIDANSARSRLVLQNDSDVVTKCRVSESTAVAATGLFLIGGDGMIATEVLHTKAALKIWNTSATEARVAVFEEVV